MQNSAGIPLGVQVIGYSCCDEKVLGVMKAIEDNVGYKQEYKTNKVPQMADTSTITEHRID